MKSAPLVSVLMPSFNQELLIQQSLDSVFQQSFEDFEIVVCDDGSIDRTADLVWDWSNVHKVEIRVLLNERNLGITATCNRLLSEARGKYHAWLAGDDLMYPEKLARQVSLMESDSACTLSFHQLEVIQPLASSKPVLFSTPAYKHGNIKDYVAQGCINGASSTVIRSSAVPQRGFHSLLPTASDWYFWVECLSTGGTFQFIDEVLGAYRRHDHNTSGIDQAISQAEVDSFAAAWILLREHPGLSKEVRAYLAKQIRQYRHVSSYEENLRLSLRCKFLPTTAAALMTSIITRGRLRK